MNSVFANVIGLVTAAAGLVGAAAALIQVIIIARQPRKDAKSPALKDRYRLIRRWALAGALLALVAVEATIFLGLPRWLLMVSICVASFALVAFGAAIGHSAQVGAASNKIPIDAQSLEGHWFGSFGNAYFKVIEGSAVKAVYEYRDGRILGTIHDGVLDGWWNELPTRSPRNNAGTVHLEMRRELRALRLDGEWLFGREGNWMIWTLTKIDENIPVSVQAKFEDMPWSSYPDT